MCKINLGVMLLIFFFIIITNIKANLLTDPTNTLIITKDIEFEVEVLSSISVGVEPVLLDFGDIQRNTNNLLQKEADLKFKSAFTQDVEVRVEYDPTTDLLKNDPNYAKYEIDYVNQNGETYNDKIEVYLKRIDNTLLKKGTVIIPVLGEIREVGNVRLGAYAKDIDATVYVTPTSPSEVVTNSKSKGGTQ